MAQFNIEIAGVSASVCSRFESTRDYCRAYLTDKPPVLFLTTSPEELEAEQELLRQEALEEGIRFRQFPDPFLERSVIQRKLAEQLLDHQVLMLHGSTVAVDGAAYLFTAKCGTGKSTHTRLWRQVFGQRAVMVNDDKPFLRVTEEGILACGSPWSGKHGLDTNITVPLKAICILERGSENQIRQIPAREAEEMLRKQSFVPSDPEKTDQFEGLLKVLMEKTAFYRMACTKAPEAARISREAMG